MPLHPDFQKIYENMVKQYGEEKGKSVFYAWLNKHGHDETKRMKERKISDKGQLEKKEENGEFYSHGYIATTHTDSVNDKISKETLEKWCSDINNSSSNNFKSTPLSIHHERDDLNLAGQGAVANVIQLPDGEYGLKVETHHNRTHPDFENTKYQLDNNFLTHYSIEYQTDNGATTHAEKLGDKEIRVLDPSTSLIGYGLASPRTVVNSNAIIEQAGYKEIVNLKEAFSKDKIPSL